jgi:starch synthase (maltosyl-transferring)
MRNDEALRRVVIESVKPEIDQGRFPIKRTVGEKVAVEADTFVDRQDAVSALSICTGTTMLGKFCSRARAS